MKSFSISSRINGVVTILIILSCISVVILSVFFAQNALKKEIITNTLPAKTSEVISEIDKQLVLPTKTLEIMARNPLLLEWIENGENSDKIPLIFKTLRNIAAMHEIFETDLLLKNSLNFYEFSNGQEKITKFRLEDQQWFVNFEKSGNPVVVTIYPPNAPKYANMTYINRRIEDKRGNFLGVFSVGIKIEKLIQNIAKISIGEKGETFLARKNGEIMFHPKDKLNGTQLAKLPGFEAYADTILNSPSTSVETVDQKNEKILISTREIPILNATVITIANYSELFQAMNDIKKFTSLAGIGILLISLIVLTFFAKTITRPISQIIHYAADVAAEQATKSPAPSSVTEIEKLRQALNSIVKSMTERLQQVEKKEKEAETALSQSKIALEEAEEAKQQAERAKRDGMLQAAGQLEGVVAVLSSASEQLSAQITQSSKGAEQQAERVAETATAMEEMNSTVLEVARNSGQASELSEQAKEKAKAGSAIVHEAGGKMTVLQEQSQVLKADMNELDQHATAISEIMSVISDIADQTNLLALNAAIEAARAGEYGRGFAVVADEVRKLAEKTMASTADVSNAITQIQESATKNIRSVDQTNAIIGEAMEKAQAASSALTEIVTLVDDSADQIRAIAAASEEQSATSEEINRSIAEVNSISQETSQAMREAAQAVVELSNQAQELSGLIQTMKDS